MEEIKVDVELEINGKNRSFEMILKKPYNIEDLEEGRLVILNLKNGEQYTGIFDRLDCDEEIILKSLESNQRIGLKIIEYWKERFLEYPIVIENLNKIQ